MLQVSHVTKQYGKVKACDDVSFTMQPQTVTILLGPNGAGKSTIMKSVIGFLKYSGEITVEGIPSKRVAAKRLIGYIPEIPALYPNLTVSEHMEFIARAYRLKDYKDYADELFERFELADKRGKFGDELSKGMQQKLSLCLGLLPRPKYILLDEPMIGLDPHAIKELKTMFGELKDSGSAILVSTHIIDSVDNIWDRTIIMQNGRVHAEVSRDELTAQRRTLEELFFEITEGKSGEDKPDDADNPAEGV